MKHLLFTPKILSCLCNSKNILLILFLLLLFNCNPAKKTDQPANELQNARWIGDTKTVPLVDSLLYNEDPAPLFRKEFEAGNEIKSAKLFITAAGYYIATLNGDRIGNNFLDPAWTNFSKRVFFTEYDITKNLLQGKNCLGVTLGNGFYNPLPMKMWGVYNIRNYLQVGRPVFIAALRITYANGKIAVVCTDDSWKYTSGPILKNNVYLGELYDARKEVTGWNKTGFNDADWSLAAESDGSGGILQPAFSPPIQEYKQLTPLSISSPKVGVYIADMGIVFSGTFRIKLHGKRGAQVTIRTGERLYENRELNPMTVVCGQIKKKGRGGPGSPDIAWPEDTYIFGDSTDVWYLPQLTSHVFRYMEITGLDKQPELSDITGIAFASNVQNSNSFSCSSDLFNSIQTISRQTFLNNLIGVQSDCAGRERFGYGGDLNATSETFISNFDMHAFYRKTIYDWVDAINDSVFIDVVPFVGIRNCGLSWESAFLTTQYYLYLYYNDTEIVRELYNRDLWWMEKVAKIHPTGIVDKGLADHESIVPSPLELIGTTHYLECARIMQQFASLMKDKKNEKKFRVLEEKIKNNLLQLFCKNYYANPINKQTLFATLLYYDVIPEGDRKSAADSLLISVNQGTEGHFTTGIFGTKYVLEALSEAGYADKVYEVVNSKKYPGWGFMLDRGATTIWETWKESDNTFSNCHPMFGTISGWFYRWIGGIRPIAAHPGFKKFMVAPAIPKGLTFVKCTYESPLGIIKSNWDKRENGYTFNRVVPKDGLAIFELPFKNPSKILVTSCIDGHSYSPPPEQDGSCRFELKTGEYIIMANQ